LGTPWFGEDPSVSAERAALVLGARSAGGIPVAVLSFYEHLMGLVIVVFGRVYTANNLRQL
jgi:hypothetical protein